MSFPTLPSDTADRSPGARRLGALGFVAISSLIIVDAAPEVNAAHGVLKRAIDPVMDVTGLWQGPWNLFAPDVDKVNIRVAAHIRFSDGSVVDWRSPDWEKLSGWERFAAFRHQEYTDSIRLDDNSGAWEPLARYLAHIVPRPRGTTVRAVSLERLWAEIPPPGSSRAPPAGPYTQFDGKFVFYTWRAARAP